MLPEVAVQSIMKSKQKHSLTQKEELVRAAIHKILSFIFKSSEELARAQTQRENLFSISCLTVDAKWSFVTKQQVAKAHFTDESHTYWCIYSKSQIIDCSYTGALVQPVEMFSCT